MFLSSLSITFSFCSQLQMILVFQLDSRDIVFEAALSKLTMTTTIYTMIRLRHKTFVEYFHNWFFNDRSFIHY